MERLKDLKIGGEGIVKMDVNELLKNLDRLHTTELGNERIRRNCQIQDQDVVAWCRTNIESVQATITRKGKNWYAAAAGCLITINASSYTIITAHRLKEKKN